MSDTQDEIRLITRQMQQRQILAMMGIPQWVQPHSPTINMADIALPEAYLNQSLATDTHGLNIESTDAQTLAPLYDTPVLSANEGILAEYVDALPQSPVNHNDENNLYPTLEKTYRIDTLSDASQILEPLVNAVDKQALSDHQATIAPFDLQGGRYENWVLLVDIQALNHDSQKLWQNITQALSLSCETSSFPICAGMDTVELANASLAGYIFKLGRREDIQVAVLTALPDGLTHPNFVSVPILNDMLNDASLKRKLWESLSNQS